MYIYCYYILLYIYIYVYIYIYHAYVIETCMLCMYNVRTKTSKTHFAKLYVTTYLASQAVQAKKYSNLLQASHKFKEIYHHKKERDKA